MIRSFKLFEVLDHQVAVCWLGRHEARPAEESYAIALRTFHEDREIQTRIWFSNKETPLKLLREGDDVLRKRCETFVAALIQEAT